MHYELEHHDIATGDGRTLRVGLLFDPDGVPRDIIVAMGTGTGADWTEKPHAGLDVPGRCLNALTRAFLALQSARDVRGRPHPLNRLPCRSCAHPATAHGVAWEGHPCAVVGCACDAYAPVEA